MANDNRTTLDACDAVGSWTGSSSPAQDTTFYYQGTASLRSQATDSYRSWTTTITSANLTSCTLYMICFTGALATKANGGVRFIIGDGTNTRAYYVGGSDDQGFPVSGGWKVYRLDTANLPASYSQDAGAAQPTLTAITSIGIGVLQSAKATGNSPNVWWDRFSYISNGSAAFTVNAGTSGTPIDFATLVSDDVTNGWGFFNNPISGSKQYGIYGAVDWGSSSPVTSTYFADSDAQVYLIGSGLSANTMDQDFISNSGGTNSFVLDNVLFVHVGERANWNFDSTNFNIQKLDGCQFIDSGTMAFHTTLSASNRYIDNCQFIGCEQINTKGTQVRSSSFANTASTTGALLWGSSIDIQSCSFLNNTTGAGIEHNGWNGTESGTATTANAAGTTLIDSSGTFTGNVSINDVVYNETDLSYGIVTSIDSNTQITHTTLSGGTDNDWDVSDAYSIATAYTYNALTFSGNTNDVDNTTSPSNVVAISKTNGSDPSTYPSGDFVVYLASVVLEVTVQDAATNAIVGAQVAVFKSSDDSVLLSSTPTDATGKVSTSVAASSGAIYIRVRQSTNIATFDTSQAFGSNIMTTDAAHSFVTGEAVVYDKDGGTAAVGLTDGTTYYVRNISSTTLTIHPTAADAIANTNIQSLTTNGSETHKLDPVRYYPTSTVGTVGADNFSTIVTMTTDTTVSG